MVGSSFRAFSVGLSPSDAAKADAALELVVYLQPFLKVVGNEKVGVSRRWHMIDIGLGQW